MKRPVFITGNASKAQYLELWLGLPVEHRKLDLPEIQSLDLRAVVTHKVTAAFEQLGQPVLVEDVALTFRALGRLPGTLIKWFLEELEPAGLCQLLEGYDDRSATAEIIYALHDGQTIHYFDGHIDGQVPIKPRGQLGFGWNPVFIPIGSDKTYAELDDSEIKKFSHRAQAINKLRLFLEEKD